MGQRETPYLNMYIKMTFDNEGLGALKNHLLYDICKIWQTYFAYGFNLNFRRFSDHWENLEDWKAVFTLLNARFHSKLKESAPLL